MQKYKRIFVISHSIKLIIATFLVAAMLVGCTKKGEEIVLTPVDATAESKDMSIDNAPLSGNDDSTTVESADNGSSAESDANVNASNNVYVHVCGAVANEGVYELQAGSRVIDAVNAAGGFDPEADTEYVNQATEVSDGLKVRIPYKRETESLGASATGIETMSQDISPVDGVLSQDHKKSGLLDINTATSEELCELPGIGEGYAQRIISYRQEEGSFKTIEDIMKVKGIKDKLFSQIKDLITV
ncbi:MAG: helix-hairpin-helix domain-containing protein [Butyrivibrio sp.]|nr:helix-hairpin-helix domain-containing protein [Butyrivibrio sp.]